ncbi:MAG: outer membrane protein transport protein [Burkholderiaceae bacterium]|jgi:long-chain fatty acid transport protein|nr:outer membrane protein transport protein [Burkholderiaceae bacterium]
MTPHLLRQRCRMACAAFSLFAAGPSWAANGAQPGGYGIKNAMMGGASIALPLDAAAGANNPAGMAYVGNTSSLNLQLFNGRSSSDYVLPGNHLSNNSTNPIPDGGANWEIGNAMSLGFSFAAFGAGADYKQPALPLTGAADAEASLQVLDIVPTISWKPVPELALGVGIDLAYQLFKAQGVIVPTPGGPLELPGHGTQAAYGYGARLGVLWQATPELWFGANYKTVTRMSSLSGYRNDLLAYSDGKIDLPAQYGVGVSWRPVPGVTLAADWLRIEWSGIEVMQDPNAFYWRDQQVLRGGVQWDIDATWTVRAGLSGNQGQIETTNLNANLLTPSINDRAYTAGVSWRMDKANEFSLGYEVNPKKTLTGTGPSTGTTLSSTVQFLLIGWQHNF